MEGARFLMSNICHVVLNSEHEIQRGCFEECSENFVPIWHLWPILQANEGRKWQKKYIICIFITTLKMSSQTGWTDRAETLSAVYKISSWSDTYGQFYRAIKAENGNKKRNTYFYCHFEDVQSNWLDPSCWIFQDPQRGEFECCIQNFFPIWHL